MPQTDKPRLLIVSFSDINSDARVLKQVNLFSTDFQIITASYGDKPLVSSEHLRIPSELRFYYPNRVALVTRQYSRIYRSSPIIQFLEKELKRLSFDFVLVNEIEPLRLLADLMSKNRIHVDLHEYYPSLHTDDPVWNRFIRPYVEWMCRQVPSQAISSTTVSESLSKFYSKNFSFTPNVVINATPLETLPVNPIRGPIKLVHSGVAARGRKLENIIEGVKKTLREDITLDLFLIGKDDAYLQELKKLACSDNRVTIKDPVPYSSLINILNSYDIGIHVIPTNTLNNTYALPNKIFDFVQARLAVISGPSPEMVKIVEKYQLGQVTGDFSVESIANLLDSLEPSEIIIYKRNSDNAATELSAEEQNKVWLQNLLRMKDAE